jgi:hypothetical protein
VEVGHALFNSADGSRCLGGGEQIVADLADQCSYRWEMGAVTVGGVDEVGQERRASPGGEHILVYDLALVLGISDSE